MRGDFVPAVTAFVSVAAAVPGGTVARLSCGRYAIATLRCALS